MSRMKDHLYDISGEAAFEEAEEVLLFRSKNGWFGRCRIGNCTWEGQEHRYQVIAESDAELHRICSHREK